MENIDQILNDLKDGKINPGQIASLIRLLARQLKDAQKRILELEQKIASYQNNNNNQNNQNNNNNQNNQNNNSNPPKPNQPYSLHSEEQRQNKKANLKLKSKPQDPPTLGRIPNADKIPQAQRTEKVFPKGFSPDQCQYSHTRTLWQLEQGLAVRVAYAVFRNGNRFGQIPNAFGKSEYSIDFIIALAFLVYVIGVSLDKACQIIGFFQQLPLEKSQADALLNQLAKSWEKEFETLCDLLVVSAMVHADETGWSINSVWAFVSEKVRILFFGVPKDGGTLNQILNRENFAGILFSDDAANYDHFDHAQKCWAHLLRKLIKLTLLDPENEIYRRMLDELLAIYHRAKRIRNDGRMNNAGRKVKVEELAEELLQLILPHWAKEKPKEEGLEKDFYLLMHEFFRILMREELFTFVTAPEVKQPNGETKTVDGTNNAGEQILRGSAMARDTGRTNKTLRGARRRTVILSILESLRLYVKEYTLGSVIEEVKSWLEKGRSCFRKLAKKLKIKSREKGKESILDRVIPIASG